ncbi:MAG TPA: hypothetical protein VKU00_05815 [Chthonomonadaceae bacterium]|nr:hypothetical protein [Chthonomonadaceae bacterium]
MMTEIEQGDREPGIRGQVGKMFDYYRNGSINDFPSFLKALLKVKGGTISRSEAALLLGCSRQRIHQIVREGKVRCWHFHGGFIGDSVIYSELSVLDLFKYAESIGRPVDPLHVAKYVGLRDEDEVAKYFNHQHATAESIVGIYNIATEEGSEMSFLTYENQYIKQITVHLAGCRQPYKRGGKHKYAQGGYKNHATFEDADTYAKETKLSVKYCSFCNPQVAP